VDTLNMLTPRRLLEEIGGFDPGYFYLAEDKDVCYRLRRLRLEIGFSPSTAVVHVRSQKQRPDQRRYLRLLNKNRLRFAVLNFPLPQLMLLPWRELVSYLRPRRILVEGKLYWQKLEASLWGYLLTTPCLLDLMVQRRRHANFLSKERALRFSSSKIGTP
jgi:GT2 family glycosyltransferase